jgi:hypothetical protein
VKHFIPAMCCAAAVALVPARAHSEIVAQFAPITHAVSMTQAAPIAYEQRPAPPTEPSVLIPEAASSVKPKADAPKIVVRTKIVRRVGWAPTGPVTMPAPEVLVMMVRGALAGVNQANFTENYSVLHEMTTPALQARVNAAQFGKAFAGLRKQNLDLSPALVLAPQFAVAPSLTPQGVLKLVGFFPSRPLQIKFAIEYHPIDGFWLIDSLAVAALQPDEVVSEAKPAISPSPNSLHASAPMNSRFWDARFTQATHFGPRLSFAADPR